MLLQVEQSQKQLHQEQNQVWLISIQYEKNLYDFLFKTKFTASAIRLVESASRGPSGPNVLSGVRV